MAGKCPICGETDPEPAELCLAKALKFATAGEPCEYSVEGQERARRALTRCEQRHIMGALRASTKHLYDIEEGPDA
jgi:hypothetical protein